MAIMDWARWDLRTCGCGCQPAGIVFLIAMKAPEPRLFAPGTGATPLALTPRADFDATAP